MPEDFVCEVKCSSDLIPENCCRHIWTCCVALCWRDAPSRAKVKVNSDRICALRITSEMSPSDELPKSKYRRYVKPYWYNVLMNL